MDQRYARLHPVVEHLKIGTFQNLIVAFQLYVVCMLGTGLSFVVELVVLGQSKIRFCNHNYVMPISDNLNFLIVI